MYTRRATTLGFLSLAALLQGCASASPYQGMSAEQLFEMGAAAFQEEDWDEAVRVFERFIFADPTNTRMVEARIYLARAYYNREDYITAASEFSRVLDRHPGDPRAPDAALGTCQSYVALSPHGQRDQSYTVQALNACSNVVEDFGASQASIEAETLRDRMRDKLARKILVAGEFYFQRKLYDSGIIYFNDVLSSFPRAPAAAEALLRLYQSYTAIDWETEAEEARARLLREFPESDAATMVRANGGGEGGDPPAGESRSRSGRDGGA